MTRLHTAYLTPGVPPIQVLERHARSPPSSSCNEQERKGSNVLCKAHTATRQNMGTEQKES